MIDRQIRFSRFAQHSDIFADPGSPLSQLAKASRLLNRTGKTVEGTSALSQVNKGEMDEVHELCWLELS